MTIQDYYYFVSKEYPDEDFIVTNRNLSIPKLECVKKHVEPIIKKFDSEESDSEEEYTKKSTSIIIEEITDNYDADGDVIMTI